MAGCLYRLTFPNGKAYIGISRHGLTWRLKRHRTSLRNGTDTLLYRAWRKYGDTAIRAEVLVMAGLDCLREMEGRAITAFGTRSPGGYNMTAGGEGTVDPCHEMVERRRQIAADPAWRARMSHKQKSEVWTTGRRAERSADMRAMWAGDYGTMMRDGHKTRRRPKRAPLPKDEIDRRRAEALSKPATRAKMSASAKRASGARRHEIAAKQTEVMADQQARLRIARSLSPLAERTFAKLRKPVRGTFLGAVWDSIPDVATFDDLFRLGFKGSALARSIANGNLRVLDETDQGQGGKSAPDRRGA